MDWKNLAPLSWILIASDLGEAWSLHIFKGFHPSR